MATLGSGYLASPPEEPEHEKRDEACNHPTDHIHGATPTSKVIDQPPEKRASSE